MSLRPRTPRNEAENTHSGQIASALAHQLNLCNLPIGAPGGDDGKGEEEEEGDPVHHTPDYTRSLWVTYKVDQNQAENVNIKWLRKMITEPAKNKYLVMRPPELEKQGAGDGPSTYRVLLEVTSKEEFWNWSLDRDPKGRLSDGEISVQLLQADVVSTEDPDDEWNRIPWGSIRLDAKKRYVPGRGGHRGGFVSDSRGRGRGRTARGGLRPL